MYLPVHILSQICPFVYWINISDCIHACSMLVGLLLTGWKYTPAGAPLLEVLIQKRCSRVCASFYFLFNVPWSFVLKSHFPTLYQIVKFGFGHQCRPHTPIQFVIKSVTLNTSRSFPSSLPLLLSPLYFPVLGNWSPNSLLVVYSPEIHPSSCYQTCKLMVGSC